MSAKAYVLIRTEPGLTEAIYSALRASPVVQSVELITGPYDLIVVIEADSANQIMSIVRRNIRPAAGVWDTITCLVMSGEE